MAIADAFLIPLDPINLIYIHDINKIEDEPHGAPEIVPIDFLFSSNTGCVGKNGTKCSATQIGPTPGPPPPCCEINKYRVELQMFYVNSNDIHQPHSFQVMLIHIVHSYLHRPYKLDLHYHE
jgi:hypothetical protein